MLKFARAELGDVVTLKASSSMVSKTGTKYNDINLDCLDDSPENYVAVQVTAMPSVEIIQPHYIHPDTVDLVNNNFDCWEKELLKNTFQTLKGCPSYMEHDHTEQSKRGYIIDAVLYPVKFNGRDVYYVDELIAVHKSFKDLLDRINKREIAVSIGADVQYSICSKCGKQIRNDSDYCEHVGMSNKGNKFVLSGYKNASIAAEICGHRDDSSSNKFFETSWVVVPAFRSAAIQHILGSLTKLSSTVDAKTGGALQEIINYAQLPNLNVEDVDRLSLKLCSSHKISKVLLFMSDLRKTDSVGFELGVSYLLGEDKFSSITKALDNVESLMVY